MTTQKTLLALTVVALLTGCGSSSSNGSVAPQADTPAPSNSTNSNARAKSGQLIQQNSGKLSLAAYSDDNSGDLNTIVINGKPIELIPAGISAGSFVTLGNTVVSGTNYQHSKFGVVDKDNNFAIFSHGFATQDMPASGKAIYEGTAAGGVAGIGMTEMTKGSSHAEVDFGAAKSVSVSLSNWKDSRMKGMNFTAGISGNKFSAMGINGQFYGLGAAELGGIVHAVQDGHLALAAFGAVKQ